MTDKEKIISENKRRSRLGLEVNSLSQTLGTIDADFHNNKNISLYGDFGFGNDFEIDRHFYGLRQLPMGKGFDMRTVANEQANEMSAGNERLRRVARRASILRQNSAAQNNNNIVIGALSRGDAWRAQRAAKKYLARRTLKDFERLIKKLDRRKEWNKWRSTDTLLDLFTSVKYSHSSFLPEACRQGYTNLVSNGGNKARVAKIARSHSIRLDPVEAPKELYKYRLRIDRIINWAYKTNLVPVMMTLTVFHRWHDLAPLCRVLQHSWTDLFSGGCKGLQRAEKIGLQGFIRRMEETINDGGGDSTNAGWHPHYHVILLIPRDKVEVLSACEEELKIAWVELMRKNFIEVFGEDIPSSYLPALMEHGLVISRHAQGKYKGKIREVHDSNYLAKIMGYDPSEVYGADKEMTASTQKNSKIPFDLLLEDTAANTDLWCEYAIATKSIPSFSFSYGLQKKVDEYFKNHTTEQLSLYNHGLEAPSEKVVARIDNVTYKFLYKNYLLEETLKVVPQGYAALEEWFKIIKEEFGDLPGLGIWEPKDIDNDDDDGTGGGGGASVVGSTGISSSIGVASGVGVAGVGNNDLASKMQAISNIAVEKPKENQGKELIKTAEQPLHKFKKLKPKKKGDVSPQGVSVPLSNKATPNDKHKYSPPPKAITREELALKCMKYLDARALQEEKEKQGSSLPIITEEIPKVSEENLSNQADLVIARQIDIQIYATYNLTISPLVAKGLTLEQAIESLDIEPYQKETVLMLAQHYIKQYNKN